MAAGPASRTQALLDRTLGAGSPRALALLAWATYVVASLGAYNVYPFVRFKMFAESGVRSASRIVVVDAAGMARDASSFRALECEGYRRKAPAECGGGRRFVSYAQAEQESFEELEQRFARVAAGGEAAVVARRIWRIGADGALAHEDCEIARCRAVRP